MSPPMTHFDQKQTHLTIQKNPQIYSAVVKCLLYIIREGKENQAAIGMHILKRHPFHQPAKNRLFQIENKITVKNLKNHKRHLS
jgi:hypothetical protein